MKISTIFFLFAALRSVDGKPPHIVFIVADDLGWNDVGFHNPEMITPNIDKLAAEGVKLNHSYVQPVCSPSRHAFMTGVYPFKAGLQHIVINDDQAVCSPLKLTFFPEKLKEGGYRTHAVGKWHLGFCNWNCTATYRGFDSFYGYYNSREDYYTHSQGKNLDFHDSYNVVWNQTGHYSTDLYSERASEIIASHNTRNPLFLYLPFQSVHEPLQVPPEYEALYPNVVTSGRKTFCGMVTALDAAIGRVVEALKSKGIYDDTLFFFTPDNGGWIPYHGNNWPLRGGKITIWEGGTRTAGFVAGAGVMKKPRVFDGIMHAVDWGPTILAAAGIKTDEGIDGISQWDAISKGTKGQRTEFVYNIDDFNPPVEGHAAIRSGDYKLIVGYPGHDSGWYPPDKDYQPPEGDPYEEYTKQAMKFYKQVGNVNDTVQLYNLVDDAYEHHDLSKDLPQVVEELKARLDFYHKQMVPANYPKGTPGSDPKYFGGAVSPGWC